MSKQTFSISRQVVDRTFACNVERDGSQVAMKVTGVNPPAGRPPLEACVDFNTDGTGTWRLRGDRGDFHAGAGGQVLHNLAESLLGSAETYLRDEVALDRVSQSAFNAFIGRGMSNRHVVSRQATGKTIVCDIQRVGHVVSLRVIGVDVDLDFGPVCGRLVFDGAGGVDWEPGAGREEDGERPITTTPAALVLETAEYLLDNAQAIHERDQARTRAATRAFEALFDAE